MKNYIGGISYEVIICENCKGTGKVDIRVNDTEIKLCDTCDGHGRLRKVITTTYEIL